MLTISKMLPSELSFAAQCTAAEGWVSENLDTLNGFYLHDPAGCFIARLDGEPVGIGVATCYGGSAFIGELIVIPAARGMGVGASLLNHAVSYLHQRGADNIYLDGVLKAVPLYERHGFRKVCRSWRFSGNLPGKQHPEVRRMQAADMPGVIDLDHRAFGARRGFFLRRRQLLYPELCLVMVENDAITGYIQGRRGEGWLSAGPMVVQNSLAEPIHLLEGFACEAQDKPFSIGILESNQRAIHLIRSLGFVERPDSPWRMALGSRSDLGTSPGCYAVGSAAKG